MKRQERIEHLHAVADIEAGTECVLKHEDDEPREAVNAIMIPMGDTATLTHFHDLYIPVCQDCQDALIDEEKVWVLFYCVRCNENQWAIRELCCRVYTDPIIFMDGCPKCEEI